MKSLRVVAAVAVAALTSLPAWASPSLTVPEPGVMGLLAAGGVAGLVLWVRNRRK